VNRDGAIVAWNEAAVRAFGYRAEQAVGQRCWKLLQGHDAFGNQYCNPSCPLREMAFQHKAVNRCQLSFRTADDERRAFTITTLVLFDSRDATLIHLCREAPAATADGDADAPYGRHGDLRHVLTAREREVLERLAEGRNTREIATLLSIGTSTVRSHVERIMRKLNVHSRLEAVAVGRKLGLH
jgi:DNA-binding CsgD family transcriptional regulator